ncbi:unnamed protein product [Diamesa serratosioi]
MKIINNLEKYVFLLNFDELYAINITNKEIPKLYFVGKLLDIDKTCVEAVQIEQWQNYFIIVLKCNETLFVYLIHEQLETGITLNSVHKIEINKKENDIKLFKYDKDVHLVVFTMKDKAANELTLYKWYNSIFSVMGTELLNIPNKNKLLIFNENKTSAPILSVVGFGNEKSNTIVVLLTIEKNRLKKLQSMNFKQEYVEQYVLNETLYLIGCSTESFCAIYQWNDNVFQRHSKLNNQVFGQIKRIYSRYSIVITENFEKQILFHTDYNIIASTPKLIVNDAKSVFSLYMSFSKKLYFIEYLLDKTSLIINFYEMKIENAITDDNVGAHGTNPLECINKLKTLLKQRILKIHSIKSTAQTIGKTNDAPQIAQRQLVTANYTRLKNTKVTKISMPYKMHKSGGRLLREIVISNIELEEARRNLSFIKRPPMHGVFRTNTNEQEIESIIAKNLIYKGDLFEGLLLKSTNPNRLIGDLNINKLETNKLVITSNKINDIFLQNLLNTTTSSNRFIRGEKIFKRIKVKNINIQQTLNDIEVNQLLTSSTKMDLLDSLELLGDININNLKVSKLNNIEWKSFYEKLFLKDDRVSINGNLIFQNFTKINKITVGLVNGVLINNLLTTSSDQEIQSDVFVNKFYVENAAINTVNNENLLENAAVANQKNIIHGPTKMLSLNINRNLLIEDNEQDSNQRKNLSDTIETIKRHIIGTKSADLSQIYNGQVQIRGSVTIKNVQAKAKITVADLEIPQNISSVFWMRSFKQQIQTDSFLINNELETNQIFTNFLNSHPARHFLLLNTNASQEHVNLLIKNGIIDRNVINQNPNIPSFLSQLNDNAVFRQRGPTQIRSPVEFQTELLIMDLQTDFINEISANNYINMNQQLVQFSGITKSATVHMNKIFIDQLMNITLYNDNNLNEFFKNAIQTNKPFEINSIGVKTFESSRLKIDQLENQNFDNLIELLENEFNLKSKTQNKQRNARISGNAGFFMDVFIATFNGKLNFNEHLNMLVLNNDNFIKNISIGGRKSFKNSVHISESLSVSKINQFEIDSLLENALVRNGKHIIYETWNTNKTKVSLLRVQNFNEIKRHQFIDKHKTDPGLQLNLDIEELSTQKITAGSYSFDVAQLLEGIEYPKRKHWNSINVYDVEQHFGTVTLLDNLMTFGVQKNGDEQIIFGNIIVVSDKVNMDKIIVSGNTLIAKGIPVHLYRLTDDSLKKHSFNAHQKINGIKIFTNPLYGKVLEVADGAYYSSPTINNVNVYEFNETLFRIANSFEVLKTQKMFTHFVYVDELIVEKPINGIPPEFLIFLSVDDFYLSRLSIADTLTVHNMNTYTFNNYSIMNHLENRMIKNGITQEVVSILTFDVLELIKDSRMTSINNIIMEEVVFINSDQLQDISGSKKVLGKITLLGPSTIHKINSRDFQEFFKLILSKSQNYSIESIVTPAVMLNQGMKIQNHLNSKTIEELLLSDKQTPTINKLMSLELQIQKQIHMIDVQRKMKRKRTKRFMYIEYNPNLEITYDATDAKDNCTIDVIVPTYNRITVKHQKRNSTVELSLPMVNVTLIKYFDCSHDASVITGKEQFYVQWHWLGKLEAFSEYFMFENLVSDVMLFRPQQWDLVYLIVTLNGGNNGTEIQILELDEKLNKWILLQSIGGDASVKIITKLVVTSSSDLLVLSTINGYSDFVIINVYDNNSRIFNEIQQINESFDVILDINVEPKIKTLHHKVHSFLLLSRKNSKTLFVYEFKFGTGRFVMLQKISFNTSIVNVVVVYIDGEAYFMVSLRDGYFYLYEWKGIESWRRVQYGYFNSINHVRSYEFLKKKHLFLTSSVNSATALTVFCQGDQH